jgi:hypothetical protein
MLGPLPLHAVNDLEARSVTLTAKHRSSLYRSLSPLVGDEEAEALLAQFPGREGDELVTKDFLRAELRGEVGSLRAELGGEIGSLRSGLGGEFAGLRTEIAQLEARMNDKFRQQTIWMSSLCLTAMTVLVGIVALIT